MKILLHLNNPYGLGADRWIIWGYKDAFEALGHEVSFFTEQNTLKEKIASFPADIFITTIEIFRIDPSSRQVLKEARARGMRVFFNAGEDYVDHPEVYKALLKEGILDFFYAVYAPEVMGNFEKIVGTPCEFLPLAANAQLHFPVAPTKEFEADISFLGARLATKEHLFRKVLLPLAKRYRVRIYGPGWTTKDKVLRLVSGASRRLKIFPLAAWANKNRISVSLEDERKIYSSSRISINIHEHNTDGTSKNLSNEREFKIPACGGFQLSDYVRGIERFFEPDKEIVIAKTINEWFEKVDYYMTHKAERDAIQKQGTARALKEHTYTNRALRVLEIYAQSK